MSAIKEQIQLSSYPRPSSVPVGQLPEPPHNEYEAINISILPPTDRGAAAWRFLAGCFLVEALLWGALPPKPLEIDLGANILTWER